MNMKCRLVLIGLTRDKQKGVRPSGSFIPMADVHAEARIAQDKTTSTTYVGLEMSEWSRMDMRRLRSAAAALLAQMLFWILHSTGLMKERSGDHTSKADREYVYIKLFLFFFPSMK